jgi:hypothetical protein
MDSIDIYYVSLSAMRSVLWLKQCYYLRGNDGLVFNTFYQLMHNIQICRPQGGGEGAGMCICVFVTPIPPQKKKIVCNIQSTSFITKGSCHFKLYDLDFNIDYVTFKYSYVH